MREDIREGRGRRVNGPAQEEGGSRGGGSASASALGECGGGRAVERMKEDKTTPPPATPTLWSRRRTAMECLHPPSLLPLASPPSPLPPAPALPPSSFPFTLPVPYLRCLLRVYRTALANLKLGGDAPPGMVRAAILATTAILGTVRISGILFQQKRWSRDILL